MKKHILALILLCLLAMPTARAENVTVHGSLGRLEARLYHKAFGTAGNVDLWNTTRDLYVTITPDSGCVLRKIYIYVSPEPAPAPDQQTKVDFTQWPYCKVYKVPATSHGLTLSLENDLNFQWGHWGQIWLENRVLNVAVGAQMQMKTPTGHVTFTAWAMNPNIPLDAQRTGWCGAILAMRYEVQHPKHGQFVDAPVNGLSYRTWTQGGTTGTEGGFWYYPGEYVTFNIGNVFMGYAQADERISPLDIFASSDTSDPPVANMARLLQSLDGDGDANGSIEITAGSTEALEKAMAALGLTAIDFTNSEQIDALIAKAVALGREAGLPLVNVSAAEAVVRLEQAAGTSLLRRNISKTPEYAVDKPKLDIMPLWVPAQKANGEPATIDYRAKDGKIVETRDKAKPLFVTYTQARDPQPTWGRRRGADIITAVSLDDGATWKRFNVSHMAWRSSFTLESGEKFPGDCRAPQQKIAENKILVVWASAYARGGKPSFAIKTDDTYPHDDPYAVTDFWGVRGKQGSVNYDEVDETAGQGIGEIPYYALWACRGLVVSDAEHAAGKFLDLPVGEMVWFKPERLTSARRDSFLPVLGSAKNAGFAIAWQEDPGGLRPGNCKGGGDGWSGATVSKKTDIWYSFIRWADFDRVDPYFVASEHGADEHGADEYGEDSHGQQPEISSRPKWLVPMSLPVRVSDNNTVNTANLKVMLDDNGLPVIDPATGSYLPLDGAVERDFVTHEHEADSSCEGEDEHEGESGYGGGWGMARYAYMIPGLGLADLSGSTKVWDAAVRGEYRPEDPECRWYSFINKPGVRKTVVVTTDGRVLDGDTGACRPNLTLVPDGKGSAWAILGYEETKGLGTPPTGDHDAEETAHEEGDISHEERPEPDDSGKNVIYHSFRFDSPDLVSGGHVLNLPALDDAGNLIPIYYKDAEGASTGILHQFKTENARRVRFLTQPKNDMLKTPGADTIMMVMYKQGREGQGKPSDIFAIRCVVPPEELNTKSTLNPFRFSNLVRLDTSAANPDANGHNKYQRQHMNMTSSTVEALDPLDIAMDTEGHSWAKVSRWKQHQGNLSDESFANPYSEAKGHRGFIRGKTVVVGYSFTPNWGRRGGDHMDFYVRRSFDGGRSWTTDPNAPETTHTLIERDPATGEYKERHVKYGPGEFEPGRNVSLLKGNSHTVKDPRLVPPMGPGTINPTYPQDDTADPNVFYVAFGTGRVLRGMGEPLGEEEVVAEDLYYTRTTDGGTTWLTEPWVINPDSASPDAGETVYRFPWLAHGTPHQGHAQIRMHPSGTRFYAIWHQWSDGDEMHVSPHDVGDDIWFRRIDFMDQ